MPDPANAEAASEPWTIFVDVSPLADRHLTGIGRYTARLALALAARGPTRFFSGALEVLPPGGLGWSQDQDLSRWGRRLWRGWRRTLRNLPARSLGLYCYLRPEHRTFPVEASVLYDFTPLIVPRTHTETTREELQGFIAKTLPASDFALAISRSTKADASWLSDFDPDRIVVAGSGPSLCVGRHQHGAAVSRRPEVGLVVSTLEPRKNPFFLLDWFRETDALPPEAELWWVGPLGWLTSRRRLRQYQSARRRPIRFLGVVPDRELCRLYRTAGWSAYPSLYEGFGLPVLDALRHGTPVLTGRHSALMELDHPGVAFFDPFDPSTVDDAWRGLFGDGPPKLTAPEALDRLYSWDAVAKAVHDALPRVAPAPGAGRSVTRAA